MGQVDHFFRHSIKVNAFQYMFKELNLCYEYRFNENFGLEATAGIYPACRKLFWELDYIKGPVHADKGWALRLNPKFNSKATLNSYFRWYITPMLSLTHREYNKSWLQGRLYPAETRDIGGIYAMLGCCRRGNPKVNKAAFTFDFFAGPGMRAVFRKGEGYYPPEERKPNLDLRLGVKAGFDFKPATPDLAPF